MKKLLVVLMVLAFVAPAMADDTLDASGSMRVEAYSISNNGFGDDDSQDLDYWDQRFRMQLRFTPADGVSATVRTDITEDTWGKLQGNTSGDGFRPGLAVTPYWYNDCWWCQRHPDDRPCLLEHRQGDGQHQRRSEHLQPG
jgi:hypothetical protein